jgi:hypothetical protein
MAKRTLTPSQKNFAKFLKDNELGPVEAGRALGVTHPTIIGWAKGTRRPGAANQKRIATWTAGLVTEDGWKLQRDRDQKPIAPFTKPAPEAA